MKLFHFFCIIVFLTVLVKRADARQLPEILSTRKYKAGIYKDFQEFLNNAPSITGNFEIIAASGERKVEKGSADYLVAFPDSLFTRKDLKGYWGACDGTSIFVNELMYGDRFVFKKLRGLGRYCHLIGTMPYNYIPMSGGIAGVVIGAAAGAAIRPEMVYILNVNNAKFYPLNKNLLRVILKGDKDLARQYESEDRPNTDETLISFIEKYNASHAHEAFIGSTVPKEIVLFRRSNREMQQPLVVTINDSVRVELSEDSFHSLEVPGDSVKLCVKEFCTKFRLVKNKTNFIQCTWRKNSDIAELLNLPRGDGEQYVREIEHKNSKQ